MTVRMVRACWFDPPGCQYGRLARVLEHSARKHCPGWDVAVERIAVPAPIAFKSPSQVANTAKLDWWVRQLELAPDGAELLLIDADTMVLRPLDDVWDAAAFDVAYTVRPQADFPLNSGVVFVRATPAGRVFMAAWRRANRELLDDVNLLAPFRRRFGGQNQAAFGKLLMDGTVGRLEARLAALPCAEWNAEEHSWEQCDIERVRIVHVKSALHRAVLAEGSARTRRQRELVGIWRELEREAAA